MTPTAAVIVPTRSRAAYLDVALASIAPQVEAAGAELIVIDDGQSLDTRAVAERHGARYIPHEHAGGLNPVRNAGVDATDADLLVFVDDDVEARDDWLHAILQAADELPDEVGVLTGPIHARIEDHRLSMCGREGPPITHQDFGPQDVDVPHAWGANMTIRRSAFDAVGRFDESIPSYGDEEEWQGRLRASGRRIRYVAAAAVEHRRAGDDARLRSLSRAAYRTGRASRGYDERTRRAPQLRDELTTLAKTALHPVRFRCANGIVMTAHNAGRMREALARSTALPLVAPGEDDFLSGASGTVGGRRGKLLRAQDAALDLRDVVSGRRLRARRLARTHPRIPQRVLALGIERPDVENRMAAAVQELGDTRHRVEIHTAPMGGGGKFQNLNALLAEHNVAAYHWLLIVDDDVDLPRHFVDRFLALADTKDLRLAQPAHRLHSHAAWPVTRRAPGSLVRRTNFVEIGPVTAFHRTTFDALLPFPDLRMGWGLDVHWSAVAAQHGWPIGIVDATPVGHTLRPAADTYPREEAAAEARAFLADRPYVRRDEIRTIE